jgi:hypothetical protein
VPGVGRGLQWTGAAIALASLCACATEADIAKRSQIAPDSAVSKAIGEAQAHPGAYPTFAQFPKKPTDMRPAGSWDQARTSLSADAAQIAAVANAAAEMPDPDAYAKRLRAAAGLDAIPVPGPETAAELDAYARELRERATPPPPPK